MSAVPNEKIYNDSPDEFAEFLDGKAQTVTLMELGGVDNPFIKAGIYRQIQSQCNCDNCEINHGEDYIVGEEIICRECRLKAEAQKANPSYAIDHPVLAEFISNGIGCKICRQFQKTGWLFGNLRGHDVYFACVPTPKIYRAVASTPNSVLIIGQNSPKDLPPALLPRVIFLSRLIFARDGALNFAQEAIEEKIPLPHGRKSSGRGQDESKPKRRQARPPIQVYTPYYLQMMAVWLDDLRKKGKTGQPTKEWISQWMLENGPSFNRRRLAERTIYRHLDRLMSLESPGTDKPDFRSSEFTAHWNGCLDHNYVTRFSMKDITGEIMRAFTVARKFGFDVKPMRNMDAADFADKVKAG